MSSNPPKTIAGDDIVNKITEFMADEMAAVDRILCESLDTESELIQEVGEYIAFTRGKKLRPMMTLLMSKALAPDRPAPTEVAASLELIHVATLLHDDVIDKATMRRGRRSVNARWGDDVAILMADFLYARAFDLALSSLRPEVMRLLCKVTQRMCEGEMLQIKLRDQLTTTREYLDVVQRKTSSLFAACTALGCSLAGRSEEETARASSFGYHFGTAFQISDDVLDFVAHGEDWGKDIGMDVSSGKHTLPVMLALEDASDEDRTFMESWLQNGRDFNLILETIQNYHGLDRALDKAREFADLATEKLQTLEAADAETMDHLGTLPAYVVNRAY